MKISLKIGYVESVMRFRSNFKAVNEEFLSSPENLVLVEHILINPESWDSPKYKYSISKSDNEDKFYLIKFYSSSICFDI